MATSVDEPYKLTAGKNITMKPGQDSHPLVQQAMGQRQALVKTKTPPSLKPPTVAKAKAVSFKKMPALKLPEKQPKSSATKAEPAHLKALVSMIAKQNKPAKAVKVTKAKKAPTIKTPTSSSV